MVPACGRTVAARRADPGRIGRPAPAGARTRRDIGALAVRHRRRSSAGIPHRRGSGTCCGAPDGRRRAPAAAGRCAPRRHRRAPRRPSDRHLRPTTDRRLSASSRPDVRPANRAGHSFATASRRTCTALRIFGVIPPRSIGTRRIGPSACSADLADTLSPSPGWRWSVCCSPSARSARSPSTPSGLLTGSTHLLTRLDRFLNPRLILRTGQPSCVLVTDPGSDALAGTHPDARADAGGTLGPGRRPRADARAPPTPRRPRPSFGRWT